MSEKPREYLHMKPSQGPCEVHDWTADDFRERFLSTLREKHGKGGLNVCADCIDRAKAATKTF